VIFHIFYLEFNSILKSHSRKSSFVFKLFETKVYYSSFIDRTLITISQNATKGGGREKRRKELWERTIGVGRSKYDRFKRFHVSNCYLSCYNAKDY